MVLFRLLRVLFFIAIISSIVQPAYSQKSELDKAKALDQQVILNCLTGSDESAVFDEDFFHRWIPFAPDGLPIFKAAAGTIILINLPL